MNSIQDFLSDDGDYFIETNIPELFVCDYCGAEFLNDFEGICPECGANI